MFCRLSTQVCFPFTLLIFVVLLSGICTAQAEECAMPEYSEIKRMMKQPVEDTLAGIPYTPVTMETYNTLVLQENIPPEQRSAAMVFFYQNDGKESKTKAPFVRIIADNYPELRVLVFKGTNKAEKPDSATKEVMKAYKLHMFPEVIFYRPYEDGIVQEAVENGWRTWNGIPNAKQLKAFVKEYCKYIRPELLSKVIQVVEDDPTECALPAEKTLEEWRDQNVDVTLAGIEYTQVKEWTFDELVLQEDIEPALRKPAMVFFYCKQGKYSTTVAPVVRTIKETYPELLLFLFETSNKQTVDYKKYERFLKKYNLGAIPELAIYKPDEQGIMQDMGEEWHISDGFKTLEKLKKENRTFCRSIAGEVIKR
ncbi:MAG: hypothetical protein KKB70_00740 [Proteobacteria bacterium]|nr:hypothetical protein [Pseudomonadota bacterium]